MMEKIIEMDLLTFSLISFGILVVSSAIVFIAEIASDYSLNSKDKDDEQRNHRKRK